MQSGLKILMLEDSAPDAGLECHQTTRAGIGCTMRLARRCAHRSAGDSGRNLKLSMAVQNLFDRGYVELRPAAGAGIEIEHALFLKRFLKTDPVPRTG